jgi:hypothetical protein
MSYARFLEGDVYVFMSTSGFLECCACFLSESKEWSSTFRASSTQQMVDHLDQHKEAGHFVPWGIVDHLWHDDKENFPDENND